MSAATAIVRGRRMAESLMLDTCTITREQGTPDEVTGVRPTVTVYSGRCKVQTYEAQERESEAGGATFTIQRYRVDVPVGSFAPAVGDVVTITAAALDPNLTGPFRVVALLHKTAATAYRLAVEEVA